VVLYERGWQFSAGLVLAVCAAKFHVYGLIAVGLILLRAWPVLAGGAFGLSILTAITLLGVRGDWVAQYRALLNEPNTHPHLLLMGNLKTLTSAANGLFAWAEIPLALAVVAVFVYLVWRDRTVERMMGYAVIAGILICQHSYSQDFVVLLFAYAVLAPSLSEKDAARFRWVVLPFVYFGLFGENILSLILPLSVFTLLLWLALLQTGFPTMAGTLKRFSARTA
jgi:hypothetical protein